MTACYISNSILLNLRLLTPNQLSHVMRKPVYAVCEQQRRRSACASAQSDQRLYFRCLDSMIPLVSTSEISSLHLVSVAAQAGLCLTWSQTTKTGFLVTRRNYKSCLKFLMILLGLVVSVKMTGILQIKKYINSFFPP